MLILLKQLSVHHGDPGLSARGASLHPLAEDGSMPVGTLNPPDAREEVLLTGLQATPAP